MHIIERVYEKRYENWHEQFYYNIILQEFEYLRSEVRDTFKLTATSKVSCTQILHFNKTTLTLSVFFLLLLGQNFFHKKRKQTSVKTMEMGGIAVIRLKILKD